MPAVVEVVESAASWSRITAVFVGAGPGSFTSLRIAAAIAKGPAPKVVTADQIKPQPEVTAN